MIKASGYNPITWDCERQGCFNKKKRPKIELFSECFPGKINFGDIDAIVEIYGNALILEWKPIDGHLKKAQEILIEKLTKSSAVTVVVVYGNAETMHVGEFQFCIHGEWQKTECGSLTTLKEAIHKWAMWARVNPSSEYHGTIFSTT